MPHEALINRDLDHMKKLKIATLHCFGSNPRKHAQQRWHFKHCAQATTGLAEWVYPAAPNRVDPAVVRALLEQGMGCTAEEVDAFGFEDPRCWFRFTDNRYVGLEESMASLAEYCAREQPDGIAGYSNGAGAALLAAAAREAGDRAFRSIRFVMSLAGPTSDTLQRHIRTTLGGPGRISIPAIIFGSRQDPMLSGAAQMASDVFDHCDLALTDEARPFANHALPESLESYDPIVKFILGQARQRQ